MAIHGNAKNVIMNGKMKTRKFNIQKITESKDGYFDRQELIPWLDQKVITKSKVLVVGAGAIGNEVLKNIALLGVGNIYIVDFDEISRSNLSRTVLFRSDDVGKKKAEIAAIRTKELCLAEKPNVKWFHGDIVWDLGTGVFGQFDLVLGCLDNVETRLAVNRQCRLAGTPWIDGGITELRCRVNTYMPEGVCHQCNASSVQIEAARIRYSCDHFKRKNYSEGKIATVQITSAFVSALMAQEAIKILCNYPVNAGKMIHFEGLNNDFFIMDLKENPDCEAHNKYNDIIKLDIDNKVTLKDFLGIVTDTDFSGEGAELDFSADRQFVKSAKCKVCNIGNVEFFKPIFKIFDTDVVCQNCKGQEINRLMNTETETITKFGFNSVGEKVLNMSLFELGIPSSHILAVIDKDKYYKYYEIDGMESDFQSV